MDRIMNHKYLGDEGFQTWLNDLSDVILEDGFEENEFTIYADHWHPYYTKAIPPLEAWQTVTKQNVLLDVSERRRVMAEVISFTSGKVKTRCCPNCGYLVTQEMAEYAKHNYTCPRCGEHKFSEFQIVKTSPDVPKDAP